MKDEWIEFMCWCGYSGYDFIGGVKRACKVCGFEWDEEEDWKFLIKVTRFKSQDEYDEYVSKNREHPHE